MSGCWYALLTLKILDTNWGVSDIRLSNRTAAAVDLRAKVYRKFHGSCLIGHCGNMGHL